MVTIGYSYPYVAKYDGSGDTDKYTQGMDLGAGVSFSDNIEVAEDNNFYANNRLDESDSGKFISGEGTITINGLSADAAKLILGVKNQTTVASGGTIWDDYDDEAIPVEVGYGHVKKVRDNGVDKYIGVVYPRVKFSMPSGAAATQGEEIDWQAQELTAKIFRSNTGKHVWKSETPTPMETEAEAYAAVKAYLGQRGV